MEDYTLRYQDYHYTAYPHQGLGGKLYLATPKSGSGKRYLIKSDHANSGCNEFISTRIAALLGLNTPECRLFASANNAAARLFRYAAAIEFFENAAAPTLDEIKKSADETYQLILSHIIRLFFADDDRIDLIRSADGRLISIDFAEGFQISELSILAASYGVPLNNPLIAALRHPQLSPYLEQLSYIEDCLVKEGICTSDDFYGVLCDCCERFMKINDVELDGIVNALGEAYPQLVVEYFRGFIAKAQAYAEYLISDSPTQSIDFSF